MIALRGRHFQHGLSAMKIVSIEHIPPTPPIPKRRRLWGGVLAIVGYILSPASWWNDAVVNIPIAYACGWAASLVSERLFLPVMLLAYWATNVAGIVMMHRGAEYALHRGDAGKHWGLRKTLIVSSIYTVLIVALAKSGLLKLPF